MSRYRECKYPDQTCIGEVDDDGELVVGAISLEPLTADDRPIRIDSQCYKPEYLKRAIASTRSRRNPNGIIPHNRRHINRLNRDGLPIECVWNKWNLQLEEAILYRNVVGVREALANGADPNASGPRGERIPLVSVLSDAVFANTEESRLREAMVRALLEHGANVNAEYIKQNGKTPLMLAIDESYGDTSVINILLENGAKLDATDAAGNTPLMLAKELLRLELSYSPSQGDEAWGQNHAMELQGYKDIVDILRERAGPRRRSRRRGITGSGRKRRRKTRRRKKVSKKKKSYTRRKRRKTKRVTR